MPVSTELYNEATYVKQNYYSLLRTIGYRTQTSPDDKNVLVDVASGYLSALGLLAPLPLKKVKYNDPIYADDFNSILRAFSYLINEIETKFGDPYASDPDFQSLKSTVSTTQEVGYGNYGTSSQWNTLMSIAKTLTDIILKYPVGLTIDIVFFE
jgi:hypothetical protein